MAERIYVIVGKDESLVGARCQELLDKLLEPEQRMTGLCSVDGDEVAVAEVLDELRTTPFLTDKRVVAVRGADGFVSKHRAILETYFEKPAATGVLVLTVSGWDARTRLAKMLPKVGELIELTPPPRWKRGWSTMPETHVTRPSGIPIASACRRASSVATTTRSIPGSIQKRGGKSAKSVSTTTSGTPGCEAASASLMTPLKFGNTETTAAGRGLSRSHSARVRTMAGRRTRIPACMSRSSGTMNAFQCRRRMTL